jgi:hypothetical protein
MSKSRVWVFRVLVIFAIGLMVLSWLLPWWSSHASGEQLNQRNVATIHPYGLSQNLGTYSGYIRGSDMPAWFAPLMWTYLGICIAALLYSSWRGEKEFKIGRFKPNLSELLLGIVGFSYIIVAILAVIVAAIRTGDYYGTHLLGMTLVQEHPVVFVEGVLRPGYYLACGVGLMCIILASLRGKIIGVGRNQLHRRSPIQG